MKNTLRQRGQSRSGAAAFTLAEVVMAVALAAMLCSAVVLCYGIGSRKSQYAACSAAANLQAMKKMEQVIFAEWIPSYGVTNIFNPALTNVDKENLEMPVANTNVITCTNYTTVTQLSTNPPYLMITVNCIWGFNGLSTVTNTISVIRGPNMP